MSPRNHYQQQSELRRFHRGISIASLLLASLILAAEMFRYHGVWEWFLLATLLFPSVSPFQDTSRPFLPLKEANRCQVSGPARLCPFKIVTKKNLAPLPS
jgi:hypothetical protein